MVNFNQNSDNYDTTYHNLIEYCIKNGIEDNDGNLELSPAYFQLMNPRARIVWNSLRETNYEFANKFFAWMVSGRSDINELYDSNPNAKKFNDIGNVPGLPENFSTAYGPRIKEQLDSVINELIGNPYTRRANIMILDAEDCNLLLAKRKGKTNLEYPCTESIAFQIRNRPILGNFNGLFLDCYVTMRSNNIVTTICYDVFNFTMLMEYVYQRIISKGIVQNLKFGSYHHYMRSAHILKNDIDFASSIVDNKFNIDFHFEGKQKNEQSKSS